MREAVCAALDDDFATPGRWRCCSGAAGGARHRRRGARGARAGRLARDEPPPSEVVELAQERGAGARRRDFAESDRLREGIAGPAGRCATPPTGSSSPPMAEVVYGRRPVREALRGRRKVSKVWCTPDRTGRSNGCPAPREAAEQLTGRAGSHEHQGVVAEVAPTRTRASGSSGRRAAAARRAGRGDRPAQPGRRRPRRRVRRRRRLRITGRRSATRDRGRMPRVGGCGRAPAIARVENLAELLLARPPARAVEVRGRGRARRRRHGGLPRRRRVRARGRGPGPAPARAGRPATGGGHPDRRPGRVAERVDGGGGAALRGRQAARDGRRELFIVDGDNVATSAGPGRGLRAGARAPRRRVSPAAARSRASSGAWSSTATAPAPIWRPVASPSKTSTTSMPDSEANPATSPTSCSRTRT